MNQSPDNDNNPQPDVAMHSLGAAPPDGAASTAYADVGADMPQPRSCLSCSPSCSGSTEYEFEDYIKTNVYITSSISEITTVIDKMCLVWVTVVLLGGFASQLDKCTFWLLAGLLLLQGLRYLMNMSIVSIAVKGTQEPAAGQEQDSTKNTATTGTSGQAAASSAALNQAGAAQSSSVAPGVRSARAASAARIGSPSGSAAGGAAVLKSSSPVAAAGCFGCRSRVFAARSSSRYPPGNIDALEREDSVTKFRDMPSKHVRNVLQWVATCCYWIRFSSYVCRAVLSALAIANLRNGGATSRVCSAAPDTGELRAALYVYYSVMAASCLVYFALIELYCWWWTLWGIKRTVRKYQSSWEGRRTRMYPWTAERHKCALRYTYYLYFKAQHESFAAMMASMRRWHEAPTEMQIALPYPWVEAVRLCRFHTSDSIGADTGSDHTACRVHIQESQGDDGSNMKDQ